MKFMEKVWGSLGLFEQVEVEDEQKPKMEDPELKNKKNGMGNVVNLASSQKQLKGMVVAPLSLDDAQHISDYLKNRKPVVVNFENTDKDVAKRMIDFISGTTYALGGTIKKIGNNIFLCAPNNVDVSYSPHDDNGDKAMLPWGNK